MRSGFTVVELVCMTLLTFGFALVVLYVAERDLKKLQAEQDRVSLLRAFNSD